MPYRLANRLGRSVLVQDGRYWDLEKLSGGRVASDPMAAYCHLDIVESVAGSLDDNPADGAIDPGELRAPVPAPQKCFGIGLNYADHASESEMEVPENPMVFTKFPSCLVGPTAIVELRSDGCDYEGELVVVIGPGGKDIAAADAWSHVAGLTVGQDISDRIAQFAAKPPHFDLGKSFDTFGPIGPCVVSPQVFEDPTAIDIITTVNGEERQRGNTRDLIFDVATLIEYLSHITTLVPGDLIFTGTPAGIGASSLTFLAHGDEIVTTIPGIGELRNLCTRGTDHTAR